ncbi:unnamed protein product [Meloidogyne enterolobii]|uniref:Uncharacterized protein n=1 Tax=Meloidogyne enterolobii TaxID=390850 RepID=A0ACB1B0V0_MELEN
MGIEENYFENIIINIIKFIFVNTQSLIDFEAMSNIYHEKIINIGGIAIPQNNNQSLTGQVANIFDFAFQNNKQIIFVSFGTIFDTRYFTDIQIHNLIKNFSQSNYLFIWAIEDDYKIHSILEESTNTFIFDRVNQPAILGIYF